MSVTPDSYEQLFIHYWDFAVNLVRKEGIHEAHCEDVAQAILVRFYERDFLTVFDPEYVTTRGGKSRFMSFRAFLAAFIKRYLLHYRERQTIHDRRELNLCDTTTLAGTPWLEIHGPATEDGARQVEDAMVSTELLEQVRTSMERVGLEGFYDLVVEMVESSDNLKISVTGIMRELGLPRPTVKAYMEVLREELAGALEAAA